MRVVLLTGAGRSFGASIDRDMLATEDMPVDFFESHERAYRGLELLDKLVIGVLHGHVLGAGLLAALACDLRICSNDAMLGLLATSYGLFPTMGTFRLPRLIGLGHARRLIFSAQTIDPEEALVTRYATASPIAMAAAKRLTARAMDAPPDTVYAEALPLLAACLASSEVAAVGAVWHQRKRSTPS